MKKWLQDRPWIWIVALLGLVVAGSLVTLVLAQLHRPQIVKPRRSDQARATVSLPFTPWP